jgi:hypothetical protein
MTIHGKETKALVFFCPSCGSAAVEEKSVLGKTHECRICRWSGTKEEVVSSEFVHEMGTNSEMREKLVNDLRKLLAQDAGVAYGKFLLKWGFAEDPIQPLELAGYLQAISEATLKAIILERERTEREKLRGGN